MLTCSDSKYYQLIFVEFWYESHYLFKCPVNFVHNHTGNKHCSITFRPHKIKQRNRLLDRWFETLRKILVLLHINEAMCGYCDIGCRKRSSVLPDFSTIAFLSIFIGSSMLSLALHWQYLKYIQSSEWDHSFNLSLCNTVSIRYQL